MLRRLTVSDHQQPQEHVSCLILAHHPAAFCRSWSAYTASASGGSGFGSVGFTGSDGNTAGAADGRSTTGRSPVDFTTSTATAAIAITAHAATSGIAMPPPDGRISTRTRRGLNSILPITTTTQKGHRVRRVPRARVSEKKKGRGVSAAASRDCRSDAYFFPYTWIVAFPSRPPRLLL